MSCGGPLYRRRQILGKLETGCAEPAILTSADGGVEVTVSPQANPEVDMNERDVARISLTKLQAIPGEIRGAVQFSTEFKGGGDGITPPPVDPYLQACGTIRRTLLAYDSTGLAGITIPYGSLVTNAAGFGQKAMVVVPVDSENNLGLLYVEVVPTFSAPTAAVELTITYPDGTDDVWTPATGNIPAGFTYTPISTGMKTITIRSEEDTTAGGYKKEIYGAMGTFSLNAESSALGKFEFNFKGVISKGFVKQMTFTEPMAQWSQIVGATSGAKALLVRAVADNFNGETHYVYQNDIPFQDGEVLEDSSEATIGSVNAAVNPEYRAGFGDFPMTQNIFFGITNPPILQDAYVTFSDEAVAYKPIFAAVGIDAANEVTVRKDANSINGLKEALVTSRSPKFTIDPEMMSEADFDLFNRWFGGDPISVGFKLGAGGDGNTLYVHAKKAQFTSLGDGDRDSMSVVNIEAMLAGDAFDNDDEYKLVFY